MLFILFPVEFTTALFARALQAMRRSADPFPLMPFDYVGIGLFYGQLTCHGTAGGFLWLYLGVCLATCRVAMESVW
jgi:hypothetical protein